MDGQLLLGVCKYLLAEALGDANFHRYRDPVSKKIGGKITTITVEIDKLGGQQIPVSKKSIMNLLDEHYSGLANAAGWSGIGIVEGMALFLDGFGHSKIAEAITAEFNLIYANESAVTEGNAFLAARAKAIEVDAEEFEFNGKNFPVIKEDIETEELEDVETEVTEAKSFSQSELESMAQVIADAIAKVDKTKAKVVDFKMLDTPGRIAGFYIHKATNKLGAPSRYWITDSGEVVMAFRYDTFGPEKGTIAEVGDKLADVVKTFKANESVVTAE